MRRKTTGPRKSLQDRHLPKYSIAIAADLSGVPRQQLRRMEESGLLAPQRTNGNTRRYSDDDLTRIAMVSELADEGINMVGIFHILDLRAELAALRAEVEALRQDIARPRGEVIASADAVVTILKADREPQTLDSGTRESGTDASSSSTSTALS